MKKLIPILLCGLFLIPGATRAQDTVRVATWNIRWFPRGCPDGNCGPTRLDMVATSIADMKADIIAVQEVMKADDADVAVDSLLALLRQATGDSWDDNWQDCGEPSSQRVGFIWNAARLAVSGGTDIEALNGGSEDGGGPCAGFLRPGRHVYVKSRGGGVDFHLVTVHFDSGVREKDYLNRRDAALTIPALLEDERLGIHDDSDVVILGDFNTMGQDGVVSAGEEMSILDLEIGPAYRRLASEISCSSYYRGRPGTLDHVLVSASMLEAPAGAHTRGYCERTTCGSFPEDSPPSEVEDMSDHCPIVIDILDVDRD